MMLLTPVRRREHDVHVTTTSNTPSTITTTDQNTGRPITWNVVHIAEEADTLEAAENGWTHFVVAVRPSGRKSWTFFVRMNAEGEVIRHSTPRVGF